MQGRAVFVTGDVGSGKTFLLQEFARLAQKEHPNLVVAGGNGNAYIGIGAPYLPFRELFALLSGDIEAKWRAGKMTYTQAVRLWDIFPITLQTILHKGPGLLNTLIYSESLLERASQYLPHAEVHLDQLQARLNYQSDFEVPSSPAQQDHLFEQVTQVLHDLAREFPLLLLLDDLQWADPGSISLLFHLGRHLSGSRILVIGAYRSQDVAIGQNGARHPLETVVHEFQRRFGEIKVDLDKADGQDFVEAWIGQCVYYLDQSFCKKLYQLSEGHPLFTVELLRGMQLRGDLVQDESGRWRASQNLDWQTLPARIEAAIAEQIDRLPKALRDALTIASVEGEVFTAEIIAHIQQIASSQIIHLFSQALDRKYHLIQAEGVQQFQGQRLSQYRFRHSLFQIYLYQRLDEIERAYLHEVIGSELEKRYQIDSTRIQAIKIGWHFQQAGLIERALAYQVG